MLFSPDFSLIVAPSSLAWWGILWVLSFGALHIGAKALRVAHTDFCRQKRPLLPLVFWVWSIDIGATIFALTAMYFFAEGTPFFADIYTELGISYTAGSPVAFIHLLCVLGLHAGVLLLPYFPFMRTIKDGKKRNRLWGIYIGASTVLLEAATIITIVLV